MKYDATLAKKYWESRINEKINDLSGVLYYSEKLLINEMYDKWEKNVIGNILKELKFNKILDIPVGIGRWSNYLLACCKELVCVDISDQILNKAKSNINTIDKKITYIKSDVSSLPFDKSYFNLILCTGLFEHLPKEKYLSAIEKFSNILTDGGKFILVINNENSIYLKNKNDNKFRKDIQLSNGYFNALTDLNAVISSIYNSGMTITHYSINPNFSVLRKCLKNSVCSSLEILNICKTAIENDVNFFSKILEPMDIVSDQIVIWCEK